MRVVEQTEIRREDHHGSAWYLRVFDGDAEGQSQVPAGRYRHDDHEVEVGVVRRSQLALGIT